MTINIFLINKNAFKVEKIVIFYYNLICINLYLFDILTFNYFSAICSKFEMEFILYQEI